MTKFHVKKGDNVVVLAGREKGKQGRIIAVLTKKSRVIVEGVQMIKKHTRKSQQNPNGAIVEREFRAARWLAIYFSSAVVGEIAGCAWRPNSAGSSVGVSGLLGALAAMLLISRAPQARVGAFVILIGAATITWFRDLHGPPILFGFAVAWLMHRLAHPPKPRKTMTRIV